MDEAKAVVNVKCKLDGFGLIVTMREDDAAELVVKLKDFISALKREGVEPDSGYSGKASGGSTTGNGGAKPICPKHETEMFKSKKGGGYFCPKVVADDDGDGNKIYCKQRADASGDVYVSKGR
jgi:hypothetical protein